MWGALNDQPSSRVVREIQRAMPAHAQTDIDPKTQQSRGQAAKAIGTLADGPARTSAAHKRPGASANVAPWRRGGGNHGLAG